MSGQVNFGTGRGADPSGYDTVMALLFLEMTQMKNTLGILVGLLLFWPSTILAADVVSGASPSVQTAGTDSVSIWITGSGRRWAPP